MSRDEVRACADEEDEMRKDEVTSTYLRIRSTEYGLGASGLWGQLRFLQCSATTYEVLST